MSGTHQNLYIFGIEKISEIGYRWVPGTEKNSEIGYRWVPGTEKISEIWERWVPGTSQKKFLGPYGYWVQAKFPTMSTPDHNKKQTN